MNNDTAKAANTKPNEERYHQGQIVSPGGFGL